MVPSFGDFFPGRDSASSGPVLSVRAGRFGVAGRSAPTFMAEHSAHAGDGVSSIWRVRRLPGPVRSVRASRRSSRWLAERYRRSGAPSPNRAALRACGWGPLLGADSVPGGAPLGAVVGGLRSQPVLAASGRGRVVLGGLRDPLRTSRPRRSRRAAGRGPSGPAGGWSRPSLREELPARSSCAFGGLLGEPLVWGCRSARPWRPSTRCLPRGVFSERLLGAWLKAQRSVRCSTRTEPRRVRFRV